MSYICIRECLAAVLFWTNLFHKEAFWGILNHSYESWTSTSPSNIHTLHSRLHLYNIYSCCQKLHQHESSLLFLASESESVSQPLPSDLRRDCHRSADGRDKGQRPDHLSEMAFTLLGFSFRSFKRFRSSLTLLAK